MPFYELTLIVRPLPKKDTFECLKRAASLIWKQDGVIRKIEYLGYKELPYTRKASEDIGKLYQGSYFLYHLSLPQLRINNIRPELKLDSDILKQAFYPADETALPEDYECTLEEELQSPFYRKSVQPLIENKNVRADARNYHEVSKR